MSSATPNRVAIYQLADFLASERYEFNMMKGVVHHTCRSAGCIGGHASVLWPGVRYSDTPSAYTWDPELLARKLRIPQNQENALCYGIGGDLPLSSITRAHAILCLHRLAETGKVDWPYATNA